MPHLRCLAGPSPNHLSPISVNSSLSHDIKSDLFEGKVAVFIKFDDDEREHRKRSRRRSGSRGSRGSGSSRSSGGSRSSLEGSTTSRSSETVEYFRRSERKGVTWSIQVQGRFLKKYNADDILFGNTFDRPLHLPWGTGAVLKFMNIIDPTLEHDLGGPKPWALSPLISTMPYFHHERLSSPPSSPSYQHHREAFPWDDSISDDTSQLKSASTRRPVPERIQHSSRDRRVYFSNPKAREDTFFGPNDLITTDFCYGFLKFPSLYLNLPAGISFNLKKYWDGQPVRFVCCERQKDGRQPRTFWCVVFEIIDDDDDDGDVDSPIGNGSGSGRGSPSSVD